MKTPVDPSQLETATLAAGCFWCTEAVFQALDGVETVVSGYTGGAVPSPTYKQICGGQTGHAEATQISFDPKQVSYDELLDLFWRMHDPTTPNRQGADVGTQYRSAIFAHSSEQQQQAEASRDALAKNNPKLAPIVTEIVPATIFYPAEDYHQDYFQNNANAPYCSFVIKPKLRKLKLDK
ncbi:MAG: peptide-methionine (S)-S-oxide reductase MsrA [Kiritimatiellia bacterium]|jgi:peptide-methionine (S)-S-oxide reductase|nr:peptide-methionine (S)-S-oxide reductase MsrA [Kiritimatiellia bacterium]MDP6810784.1 peptide-methionine (S)-S-oxide reductase MsrA [Kiritimatiellia bacterium]MDP7024126.1 peptide-methionine (S)-S-oxide reductase MsrA [Kiritimatiellia bacterium]